MTTFMIGYDLNNSGKNYEDLIEAIKGLANGYWHNLDSTWIVNTTMSAVEVRDTLKATMDSDDELLVAAIGTPAAWFGFKKSGSEWLMNNL